MKSIRTVAYVFSILLALLVIHTSTALGQGVLDDILTGGGSGGETDSIINGLFGGGNSAREEQKPHASYNPLVDILAGGGASTRGECTYDSDCGGRAKCQRNNCVKIECTSSKWDCPSWQHCLNNRCVSKSSRIDKCSLLNPCEWPERCSDEGVCE